MVILRNFGHRLSRSYMGDIDLALDAVFEAEEEAVLAEGAGFDDVLQHAVT